MVGLAVLVRCGVLAAMDRSLLDWLQVVRSPPLDQTARAVTSFGSTVWTAAVIVAMGLWWAARRRASTLGAFLGAVLLGVLVQAALRISVEQWRPDTLAVPASMDLMARFGLAGFPSGHAFRSAFLYGWWGQWLLGRRGGWAVVGAIGCGLLILLVGASRVYLGRHWPTDVLGAWLVAVVVLSIAKGLGHPP